jgi:hypothetical protein
MEIGMRVLGQWSDGRWYPGVIAAQRGGEWFVQFDDGDTAWLQPERIRAQASQGAAGPAHAVRAAPAAGGWEPGVPTYADWTEDNWYPGYVAEARPDGMYFVQFDDGDVKWLPPHKLRPRTDAPRVPPGAGGDLAAGERVSGRWHNGRWYNGHIGAVSPNRAMYFVQFDDGDRKWLPPHDLRVGGRPVATVEGYYAQGTPAPAAAPPDAPAAPQAGPVVVERIVEKIIERQVLVLRCPYCKALTPADLDTCNQCGGRV